MTEAQTQTFPREWMDLNWIMAQQELTGMDDDALMVVHSVAMGIGHALRNNCHILCKYVETGPNSGHYPTINPGGMHLVLTEAELLREARKYARLTLGDAHIQTCLKFLDALTTS